jgi:integrase
VRGRRIEERTAARSEAEAKRILRERVGEVAKGGTPAGVSNVRVGELRDMRRAEYRNRGARRYESSKHLRAAFPDGELARSITTGRIQLYADKRLDEGAARATVRREVAELRCLLRLGYAHGLVAQLPVFPNIRVDNARMVFFSEDEFDRLLDALSTAGLRDSARNAFLPVYLTLAFWVGWRRNELLDLEWRRVDLERGTISLDPGTTKNKEGRRAFLPEPALAGLRQWRVATDALEREQGLMVRHVFHRRGERVKSFPYDIWHRAVKVAGLGTRRIPHDFRRTAARNYRRGWRDRRRRHDGGRLEDAVDLRPLQHQERRRSPRSGRTSCPIGD